MGESPGSLEEKGTMVGGWRNGEKELGGEGWVSVLQLSLMLPTDINENELSFLSKCTMHF